MSQSPPDWQAQLAAITASSERAGLALKAFAEAAAQLQFALSYTIARYTPGRSMSRIDHFSSDEFPLEIGSLFGVRYWSVSLHNMRTGDITLSGARKSWVPGENRAECDNKYAVCENVPVPHEDSYATRTEYRAHTFAEIPSRSCGCGYWAYWAPEDAPVPGVAAPSVMGVIEGWENYRTGPKGLRCSAAQIVALHVVPAPVAVFGSEIHGGEDWRTKVEGDLAARYKVPVYSDAATMLKAYPTSRTPPPAGPARPKIRKAGRGWRSVTPSTWQMPASEPLCAVCHSPAMKGVLRTGAAGPVWACASCVAAAEPCGCSKCAPHYARGGIVGSSVSSRVQLSPLDALKQLEQRKKQWGP